MPPTFSRLHHSCEKTKRCCKSCCGALMGTGGTFHLVYLGTPAAFRPAVRAVPDGRPSTKHVPRLGPCLWPSDGYSTASNEIYQMAVYVVVCMSGSGPGNTSIPISQRLALPNADRDLFARLQSAALAALLRLLIAGFFAFQKQNAADARPSGPRPSNQSQDTMESWKESAGARAC